MAIHLSRESTARGTRGDAAPTLASAFDPRANSLTMLRLALATIVAMVHAGAVAFGAQPTFSVDPLMGPTTLGDLAVDAFFVLSGFLVTMSYLRLNSVPRYLWHRVLRIMPAFWVCLVVTALVVGPIVAVLEGRPALSAFPESLNFVWRNAALHMFDYSVGGAPQGTFTPGVINGALWTLFYEFLCYLGVVVLGVLGFLARRTWMVPLAVVALMGLNLAVSYGLFDLPAPQLRRFMLMFLLGACGLLFGRYIRISGWLALASLLVVAVALMVLPDYRPVAGPAFAYMFLWATVRLPLRWDPGVDLSYGMYIFHWPIETMLVLAGAAAFGVVPFVAIAVLLSGAAAAISWFVIEKPALSHKSMPFPGRKDPAR